ncbi:hypothetical protein OQA88_4348 [Cercophora sp. LCS_1]
MKAIKITGPREAEIQDAPIPALRDDYVLVKVKAVALNPTDWKHIDFAASPGSTVGCDFAGVVEEVGSKVEKPWKKGDRIAGFTHGSNAVQPEDGCFAQYCAAKGDLGAKIPDHMTDEEASALGVGITTVGQALYQSLGLPLPGSDTKAGFPILIYGGSSATGSLAIQYARLSGCSAIVTTCSPHNFGFAKSLGADAAFDYADPQCAQRIQEYTKNSLAHVLDCISSKESAEICSAAIGANGGTVSHLFPVQYGREGVQAKHTIGYTVLGEYFRVGDAREFPAQPQDFEFGKKFWALSERLLAEGQIRAHPPDVGKDGLKGVFGGLQAMREGRVSGKKLVYRVEETP